MKDGRQPIAVDNSPYNQTKFGARSACRGWSFGDLVDSLAIRTAPGKRSTEVVL